MVLAARSPRFWLTITWSGLGGGLRFGFQLSLGQSDERSAQAANALR